MKIYHARYRCLLGNRKMNRLLSHAGLGVTGAFEPEIHELTWKPGETVDDARAGKLCEVLKQGLNESKDFECASVQLIAVWFTV